jgi:uncharacterized protein (TIGR02271 family)
MDRSSIYEGQKVWSRDGEKLGKVIACGAKTFMVEKGFLLPKELIIPYEDVATSRDGEIELGLTKDELLSRERLAGERITRETDLGRDDLAKEHLGSMATETTRVPLTEEELAASKRVEKVGEVGIRKEVHTEEKSFTVPVTKERVTVERGPVQAGADVPAAAFKEDEIRVPIYEEKVEVTKRPVVKEEIRIKKEAMQTEERVSATVKKEEAEIEGDDELERFDDEHRPIP